MVSLSVINADKDLLLILMDLVVNTVLLVMDLLVKNASNALKTKLPRHIANVLNAQILILNVNSVFQLLKMKKFMSNVSNAKMDMLLIVMD